MPPHNSKPPALTPEGLLAMHLHREEDGSWYATGVFADESVGKHGQRLLTQKLPPEALDTLTCYIETGEPFRCGPSGKIQIKISPEVDRSFPRQRKERKRKPPKA